MYFWVKCYNDSSVRLRIVSIIILGLSWLVFLGGVAKVNSILVMVLRNANQAFLAPLPVMDLKPPHLVIALRNANSIAQLGHVHDAPSHKQPVLFS
jgi:hypothetical protein